MNMAPTLEVTNKTINVGDSLVLKTLIKEAKDNEDGSLLDKVTIDKGDFDNTKAGEYKVTYKVADKDGASCTKVATVTVKDVSSMPELTKQEENPEIITADYVDTEGNKLADTVFSDKKAEKKNFPGYTFEKEEKTLTGFKYIYKKKLQAPVVEKPAIVTTDYVDTEGNKLADTVFSDKKAEKKNFPGYTFEKEEKTLTGFKCIYRKDIKPCPCPEHSRNLSRRHQQNVR